MEQQTTIYSDQYGFVKEARHHLFYYCATITAADLVKEHSSFGRGGSMRNLLVHSANVYEFWIGNILFQEERSYAAYEDHNTLDAIINLYASVDRLVDRFILHLPEFPGLVDFELNDSRQTASPNKIFTHVLTHEFHHKGQILSISRQLGYTPADTDVIR